MYLTISDVYVVSLSNQNQVAAKDYYLGIVSTTVETANPEAELKTGLDILAPIELKFVSVKDVYEPTNDGKDSQVRSRSTRRKHRFCIQVCLKDNFIPSAKLKKLYSVNIAKCNK